MMFLLGIAPVIAAALITTAASAAMAGAQAYSSRRQQKKAQKFAGGGGGGGGGGPAPPATPMQMPPIPTGEVQPGGEGSPQMGVGNLPPLPNYLRASPENAFLWGYGGPR